jgi:hypothetical protein
MVVNSITNPFQIEPNGRFKATRSGKPIDSGDFPARGSMIGIMGQTGCSNTKEAAWEQVSASSLCRAPKPEGVRADMVAPVKPRRSSRASGS